MSRDKLTLSEMLQENIHLDEQLTDAQHTIGMQVETIDSLQAEIEQLKANLPATSRGAYLTACCQTMRDLRAEIERLRADLGDLNEKYAQSESDRLDAETKLERLHQIIEQQHPERKEDQ